MWPPIDLDRGWVNPAKLQGLLNSVDQCLLVTRLDDQTDAIVGNGIAATAAGAADDT